MEPQHMAERETDDRLFPTARTLVAGAVLLIAALTAWGYLRGIIGQTKSAIKGIKELTPEAEERNRLVDDLTRPPSSEKRE
jgi:hypothetical protein